MVLSFNVKYLMTQKNLFFALLCLDFYQQTQMHYSVNNT